jgi:hypothetical protein
MMDEAKRRKAALVAPATAPGAIMTTGEADG